MNALVTHHRRSFALLLFIFCQAVAMGQLTAKFSTSNARAGCSPLVVNFTDSSTGNPTQWKWDLGNGVTSLLKNPSTTYFNPGTYSVKLVVRNNAGADSIIKTDYITVFPNPTSIFTADKTAGCFPLSVNFSDGSNPGTGSITNWFWDFGDGNTSTQQNPSHVYTAAGNYTVTLRVINSSGCHHTFTKSQYISISNGVKAGFSANDSTFCASPAVVNFINTSTGSGPLSYTWFFGDGGTSNAADPGHTYSTNGTYTVMLVAASPLGCTDTLRKENWVSVGNISAGFSVPDTVCANEPVSINNTSAPAPVSSSWSFGNGQFSTAQNPTISYVNPGSYTIKLVANFGACSDSISKSIFVNPKPQPAFDADTKVFCSTPATVSFTNQSTGSGTVLWNFGDGTTSAANNPTHTYTTEGNFTVTLTVTNASGCSETITKTGFIQIQKPQLSISGLPVNGCVPVSISPTVTVSSNHSIAGYLWKFGDGATSASPTPSHTYSTAGTYTVTLVYTTTQGCTDSVVISNAVRVGNKPTAAFTLNPKKACAFQDIYFADSSSGTVDQWLWNFGDGGSSTAQNPLYQYSDTGWFHVQLIVYHNTCPDTILVKDAIYIKPPIAAFTVADNCTDKFTKTFTDKSLGATTWFWTFGDNTSSTQQNPVHTYSSPGSYLVKLTVTNDTCSHSFTQTVNVIDEKAFFTSVDTLICRNQTAGFISSGINRSNIASWSWDFGDGYTASTDSTATHAYTTSGNYLVTLTITDLLGCVDSVSLPVTVYGPVANFTVPSITSCLLNNNILFTDQSTTDGTHPIVKWEWNYGDGTIDSSGNAPYQHSYNGAGNYTVSLLVKDSYGCTDFLTKNAAVTIAQPKADFFSADTINCTGSPVRFTNNSTGINPLYEWSFGDGNSSTANEPTHHYASIGTYSVKLLVTDQYGCKDSLIRPDYISISYPKARFTVSDSVSTCPPLLVNFYHQSTDYTSLSWDFGDGTSSLLDSPSHFYTAPGIYNATLTVKGPGGCTDVATQKIEIKGPSGSFTYSPISGCKPLTVNFVATTKDNATYTWDFADGSIEVSADSIISHTYINAGDFTPKMILTDAGGCSVPITGTEVIKVTGITAGFTIGTSSFCEQGTVAFKNTTVGNDVITGYSWNFGDGGTSTDQHPSHFYASPGVYTVSLNVTSQNGCQDSVSLVDTVKVYANPSISISNDSSGCTPVTVSFKGQIALGDSAILGWHWNFGNGQTGNEQNPATQIYTLANAYTVTAIATDDHGCADTASKTINAYPIPVTDAGKDVFICRGGFTELNATGAFTYNWKPDTTLSCTTCSGPLAAPTDSTQYYVTGTSAFGCSSTDSVMVRVHQPFTMTVGAGDTICSASTVHLNASGADQYTWSPSTAVTDPKAGHTTANPTTTTLYQVIGKDNFNCFADTGYVNIKVWPYPTVDAGADKTVSIGSSLILQPAYSGDVISYQWNNPMQTLSCTTCPTPTVNTKGAQNTYSIEVTNEGGCVAKDDITIYAICNGSNLFIPNTFSPNADGKNDRFYLRGSGLNKVKSLRIFNRWGELVFDENNFDPNDAAAGWNGEYKGKPLPPDVYVYTCEVICMNNEILIYQGNITLLK